MTTYFTDREYGQQAPGIEIISEPLWAGLHSLIQIRINSGAFGLRFPEYCRDGNGPCGCDMKALGRVLRAEIPKIEWPLSPSNLPDTSIILDLLEFCAAAVGKPIQDDYHSYYGHYHLHWDRDAGLAQFIAEVNLLFRRNGVAYELTATGSAQRLLPQPVVDALAKTALQTGDQETDRLLATACRRFLSPKAEDRRDALEKLWDAFERLKTHEPGKDKKAQTNVLLDRLAAPDSAFREALEKDARELTDIGNTFRIRHSETTQEALTSLDQVDYLFMRMLAFLRLAISGIGR